MRRATERGFTLIEMIVAIVVGGVLVALSGMFVRNQLNTYFDISARADLTDTADLALRRISRELQGALPNSVRVSGNSLEFIPINDAGRYRVEGASTTQALDFGASATATVFDVLGPPVNIGATDSVVVYNLGLGTSDAYSGGNLRTPSTKGTALSAVGSATAFAFPFASPANRFHIVGAPVTYECDLAAGVIRRRTGYGFLAAQSAVPSVGSSAVLAGNVTGCSMVYTPGVLQRNGLVSISLTLTANGEVVVLQRQIEVLNTP